MTKKHWDKFFLGIILPTLLAIIISIVSIYMVIIPAFKDSFLDNKKEMIEQLTNVALDILVFYEAKEKQGDLDREDAQKQAIAEIKHLRYGEGDKDYFWITDMHPRMIMHPYSPELDNRDLSLFLDAEGSAIFVQMKEIAEQKESGYLNYTWHAKYNDVGSVPKLSYVKKFEPWQWVVGTGVFLDDVEEKTAKISSRMASMILITVVLFTILLGFVAHQSYMIEKKRLEAEEKLKLSREKYKALAESATDPMVMVYENNLVYANRSMCSMLGYSQDEIKSLSPIKLFPVDCEERECGLHLFHSAISGQIPSAKEEGLLTTKDGMMINVELSFSPMQLSNHTTIVMAAKDVRSGSNIIENNGRPHGKYQVLDQLHLGTFRVGKGKDLPLLEASTVSQELLGIEENKGIKDVGLLDFFSDINEKEEIFTRLSNEEVVKNATVHLRTSNKETNTFSLSLVGSKDSTENIKYYDGIIEDISEQKRAEQDRESLIVELQTSLLFLNQPIKYSLKNFVSCQMKTSIAEATRIMAGSRLSSILVTSESGEMIGIITDMVLRERVIAENLSYDTPVFKVMSSPLIYIASNALIFEAVLLMQEKGIKHLVVQNSSGETISVISNEELLHVHRYSTAFMLSEIREADSIDDILSTHIRVPRIVKSLIDSGAHAKNITRVITKISDTVLEKIIDFAIEELGEPPKRFAFISLGSEGRGEQTLVTDQDNAIIYEDITSGEEASVQAYFKEFGEKVCTWLDMAGYDFCLGEIMAMNQKWCQPISVWKEYFSTWMKKRDPKDLLEVSIFFDFRCLYGDTSFTKELRGHIAELVSFEAVFLQHFAKTSLAFRPPIDFFGNIQAGSSAEHSNSVDIKNVIACIVGLGRVYAVEAAMESTNTIERIEQLYKIGKLNRATHTEIIEAYNYLMQQRFRHQVDMIDRGKEPDNFIDLDDLSHMDKVMLKKTFSQVVSMQKQLSLDFTGIA